MNNPKWMVFLRETDGHHFLWNGEGCLRVSPIGEQAAAGEDPPLAPRWHYDYGCLPQDEINTLDNSMNNKRARKFSLPGYGRYRIIARGEFEQL